MRGRGRMRWQGVGIVLLAVTAWASPRTNTLSAAQARTGGLQGIVTTRAKAPRPLRITYDQKVCGDELPNQSILVDPAGHLANVVVTLVGVKARTPQREVKVVNEKCAFVPRVQAVGSKATLKTSSKDPILHTTTVQLADGRQLFNLALPVPNLELAKPLDGSGALRIGCSTHQWMRGWLYVTDDVAVVTGPDGRFALPDVAPGTYQLRVWHEALKGAERSITIAAGTAATADIVMQ